MEESFVERRITKAIERGELLEAPQIGSDVVCVGLAICGAVARAARREAARAGKEAQPLSRGPVTYRGATYAQEGVGEPIPNLDQDPDWWVKGWIEREDLKGDLRRGRAPRREGPRDPEDP